MKRQEFPRLFFLSQKDIRFLLINPDKVVLSRFMTYLFMGVKNIDLFPNGEYIKGITGHNNEKIVFKKTLGRSLIWTELK